MDDEIVQKFCEDCLGKKIVILTKKEQEKVEKKLQQSQYITLHWCGSLKQYLSI